MLSFSNTLVLGGALLVGATTALVAGAQLSAAGTPDVRFVAVGPVGMKIEGKTSDLKVADDGKTITVDVPLAHLKTGIGLRDRHMRDKYLQVDKYPDAKLTVERSALHLPADGATLDADAPGRLVLHGHAKNVTFHYSAHRAGNSYSVSGRVHVDMHDYGIEVPSYLGVTVKPGVAVNVRFSASDH